MGSLLKLTFKPISIFLLFTQLCQFKLVTGKINGTKNISSGKCRRPMDLPSHIHVHRRKYENWIGDIQIPSVWVAVPKNPEEIVKICNWAASSGYRIRPKGGGHSFSPLTISKKEASKLCPKILLVDTTKHLKNMVIKFNKRNSSKALVVVETGVMLENLLEFLEQHEYGVFQTPPLGDISIGGMLATGTYGTGIPGMHDSKSPGHTYGSMSNLIVDMTVVAWDSKSSSYKLKTFHRSHKDCKAFMMHLGRTFVTSVSLSIGKNQNLRKFSRTDISVDQLFADPENSHYFTLMMTHLANKYGRIEAILMPFGKYPLTLIQYHCPEKPEESREITTPYPYAFMNFVPQSMNYATQKLMTTITFLAKYLGFFGYIGYTLGIAVTATKDLWGPSKNHFLFVKSQTIHMNIEGYAIVTSPENLQKVLFLIYSHYSTLLQEYADRNMYPVNGGLDVRITGVDNTGDLVNVEGETPCLSPISPVDGKPEFTRAVVIDIAAFPSTPFHSEFMEDFENFLFTHFDGRLALVRPAWSKGWAFTEKGPWTNHTLMKNVFPRLYTCGEEDSGFKWAASIFEKYDPFHIYTNSFLETLMTP